MRKSIRFGLVASAALAALALAGPALAAFSPKLAVASDDDGTTAISYQQAPTDDAPAMLTFFVPVGYIAQVGGFPVGTQVGTASGKVTAADLAGSTLSSTGTITVAAPTDTATVGGAPRPLSALAQLCTGSTTASAFWLVNLSASGQTLQVPIFVDQVVLGRAFSDFASYTLTVCLPPPDVPAGTPGRASFGAKLFEANLVLQQVFSIPPAWYVWRLRATPYTPGTGQPNVAGTVETQSLDRVGHTLELTAKSAGGRVVVSGRLTQGGGGVGAQTVTVKVGPKTVGTFKTKPNGRFSGVVAAGPGGKLVATATVPARALTACQSPAFAPAPCLGATVGGFTVSSAATKVPR